MSDSCGLGGSCEAFDEDVDCELCAGPVWEIADEDDNDEACEEDGCELLDEVGGCEVFDDAATPGFDEHTR